MRRRAAIVIILTALAAAVPAAADPLSEGIEAYRASHYDVALKTLNEALLQEGYSTAQIVECRRYLGMTHIAFGDTTRAKGQFVEALKLDPAMSFDPITTSPKVLAVFEEAKAEFEAQRPLEPIPVAEPEAAPEPEPEPEPEAVAEEPVRQERDHTKRTVGWSLVGVGGASLIVSGVTYAMLWDTAAKYNAEDKDEDRANRLKEQGMTLQTVSAVTAGVAVVAGGIGAYLLMDDAGMFASRSGPRLLVSPGPTPTVLVRMEFF